MPSPSATTGWPPWAVMWALAAAIFALLKWLTWQFTPAPPAPAWRHAAYLLLWPGLDARAFLDPRPLSRAERPRFRDSGGRTLYRAGAISLTCAEELAAGSRLARAVCIYGALFWGRLSLQAVFGVKPHLTAWWLSAGYHTLTVLFLFNAAVYCFAALR